MNTFDEKREREEQNGSEWQFGAIQTDLGLVPIEDRIKYLPEGVLQFNALMDSQGCASRGPLNALEAKFTYFYEHGMHPDLKRWTEKNGYVKNGRFVFDDNYIEILSGTTTFGNSLKAPLEAIRKFGLIPKTLPIDGLTWEEYMNPARITEDMKKLGAEFLRRFTIGYEQSNEPLKALEEDYTSMALHAWPEPVDGIYQSDSKSFNHCVAGVNPTINVFDNYVPFLKSLSRDYALFPWAYSLSITAQNPYPDEQVALFDVLSRFGLLRFFAEAWRRLLNAEVAEAVFTPQLPTEQEEPFVPVITATEFLHQAVVECLGKDMGKTQDELACAESVNAVHKVAFGKEIGGGTSTALLYKALKADKTFQLVTKPENGVIIISPTGMGNTTIPHGHAGYFTEGGIASNDSRTGKFVVNFTVDSWVKRYRLQGNYPIFYFKKVV